MEEVKVLIVTDAQVDFESGSIGSKEAQATVSHIVDKIDKCGQEGYIILDTKDTHEDDYMDTHEGQCLPIPHTIRGTEGWEVVQPIKSALKKYGAIDVLKDKFGSTDLASVVRVLTQQKMGRIIADGKGLTITIIGWCTDICVITNALLLRTAFPEAEIIVDPKCCAGATPESHEAAITVMRSCQIIVI